MSAPARIVDALGTHCPVPVYLVERALRRVEPGETVELLADDPLVQVDLPAWCHEAGHDLLSISRDMDRFVALVRRVR